jgi:prepilin-type processing-associated H-X9-DG protein
MGEVLKESTKTCTLAVWSLVLGIVGLVCCGLFGGVPAVVCGHMAQSRIRQSGGALGGAGLAVGGLVTGYLGIVLTSIALLGVLAGMLLPAVAAARDKARRASCMNNLSQIGLAAHLYAADHEGSFPAELRSLEAYIGDSPRVLVSPATGREPGQMSDADEWSDYALVPGRSESDPADAVLAFSKPDCYPGKGGNVLFVDGHVRWCATEEYERLTADLFR